MLESFIKFDNILNYYVIGFQILYNNTRMFRAEIGKILTLLVNNKIEINIKIKYFN